jgi:hypothetical protein
MGANMKPTPVSRCTARDLRRLQLDVRAQRFQHVGAAGLGRHAAVAVLGDARAGGGGDEHAGGGDVEGVRAVATGADDVDQVRGGPAQRLGRELAHHRGGAGDLADGFLLHPQPGQDGRGHAGRNLAAHDLPHQVDHLVVEDLAVLDGALQGLLRGDRHERNPKAPDTANATPAMAGRIAYAFMKPRLRTPTSKLARLGNNSPRSPGATPNQVASVAAY